MNKVLEIVTFTSVKMMVNWKFEGDYHVHTHVEYNVKITEKV